MGLSFRDWVWLWSNVVVFTVVVLFMMVKSMCQAGVTKYFHWKSVVDRPAALDDPALGKHGYLHLKDVRIHYVASGSVDKPLMLFLHGFPEFWFTWRHQIKEFQKDYRVVAVDMRGYGESDKPKGLEPYALHKLVKDVKQIIRALGYQSCTLVAHDWGGLIAWAVGKLYPDSVERLIVLNAPPANVMRNLLFTDPTQKKKSWYMFSFQMSWLPELMMKVRDFANLKMMTGADDEAWIAYKYVYSQPGAATPPINYYRSFLQQVGGLLDHDLDYSMPVLLLWGVDDPALSVAVPQAIHKENPGLEVKYIQDASHYVHHDAPETVNRVIRQWLADAN